MIFNNLGFVISHKKKNNAINQKMYLLKKLKPI
jgi:hypothetical protein